MDKRVFQTGVTLIEILVTLGIVVLLATILTLTMRALDRQNDRRRTQEVLAVIDAALQVYHESTGSFPATNNLNPNQWIVEIARDPATQLVLNKIESKLIRTDGVVTDVWGTPLEYVYETEYTYPKVRSAGPNRIFADDDDIRLMGLAL